MASRRAANCLIMFVAEFDNLAVSGTRSHERGDRNGDDATGASDGRDHRERSKPYHSKPRE